MATTDEPHFSEGTTITSEQSEKHEPPISRSRNQSIVVINEIHCILLKNSNCWTGILVYLLCIFLTIVSIFYALGQITSLQIVDFFCPQYTSQQVLQHSIQYGLNEGDSPDSCWSTKSFRYDESKLFNIDEFNVESDPSGIEIFQSLLWFIIATINIITLITFGIFYINDCRRYSYGKSVRMRRNNKNKNNKHKDDTRPSTFHKCCPCCICCPKNNKCLEKIGDWYFSYYSWYKKYFGEDKILWLVYLIIRESAEILLQTTVLYIYSGYNLFTKEIELGKKSNVVIAFAFMLCFNCIIYGLCWCGYAFIGRICRGLFFKQLLFVIDTIFDTFYSVFPLFVALRENNGNLSIALATLNLQSGGTFAAVFLPMCYLAIKSGFVMFAARKRMNDDIYNYLNPNASIITVNASSPVPTISALDSASINTPITPSVAMDGIELSPIAGHVESSASATLNNVVTSKMFEITEKQKQDKCRKWCNVWRLCAILVGIIFFIIGSSIIISVTNHYNKAELQCINPSDEELEEHVSLLFFENDCQYKVYPMGMDMDIACQCRRSEVLLDSVMFMANDTEQTAFQVEVIQSVLRDWTMLETLKFIRNGEDNKPVFHWDDEEYFGLKFARTIKFNGHISLAEISKYIANLKQLDVLWIDEADDITSFPDEMGELSNLRILILKSLNAVEIIPESFCKLKKLKGLQLQQQFKVIPMCLKELTDLETLQIDIWWTGDFIPELLTLPKLQEVTFMHANFTSAQLLGLKDINDPQYWTKELKYHTQNTKYYFTYSAVCDEYWGLTDIEIAPSVKRFINATNACHTQCEDGDVWSLFDIACFPWNWNNGICDDECNKEECGWDGGDCNQLCDDECDIQQSFGDGNCSTSCNNTYCSWDFYDCQAVDEGACWEEYGCNITWLNDDICDLNCFNSVCRFDRGDCDPNCKGNICDEAYVYYSQFANYHTNDNLVQRNELCALWGFLNLFASAQGSEGTDTKFQNYGCNKTFDNTDLNEDGSVSISEFIKVVGPLFKPTLAQNGKAEQVDCSQCLDLDVT